MRCEVFEWVGVSGIQCTRRGLALARRRENMGLDEVDRFVGGRIRKNLFRLHPFSQ